MMKAARFPNPKTRCATAIGTKKSRVPPLKENISKNANVKSKKGVAKTQRKNTKEVPEKVEEQPIIGPVPEANSELVPEVLNTQEIEEVKVESVEEVASNPVAELKTFSKTTLEPAHSRFKRKTEDSPNTQKRMKQMQIIQEELKRQIEEKKIKKELEKKKLRDEAEREEQKIKLEKEEIVSKFQEENYIAMKKTKAVTKEVHKIFQPSEDNSFAIPTPSKKVVKEPTEKLPEIENVLVKEYERRIKQLEIEKENALKTAMMYKDQLFKERGRKGKCGIPLELYEESLESSTKFIAIQKNNPAEYKREEILEYQNSRVVENASKRKSKRYSRDLEDSYEKYIEF